MTKAIGQGIALAALIATLAACGGRQPLKPVEGQRLPAVPVGAATAPTGQQLTTPSTQARPERNVELLRQSDEREDDPFDLPPERSRGK
jgi:predicted small lipoprotein YifL